MSASKPTKKLPTKTATNKPVASIALMQSSSTARAAPTLQETAPALTHAKRVSSIMHEFTCSSVDRMVACIQCLRCGTH